MTRSSACADDGVREVADLRDGSWYGSHGGFAELDRALGLFRPFVDECFP